MNIYTAVFSERLDTGDIRTFGIEMQLTIKAAMLEVKEQVKSNGYRFIELRKGGL